MIGQETREVERKITAILKALSDSAEPLGGRTISRRFREQGIDLSVNCKPMGGVINVKQLRSYHDL